MDSLYVAVLSFVLLIAGIIWGGNALKESRCESQYSAFGKTSYTFMQGCVVEYKGKKIPATSIRVGDI